MQQRYVGNSGLRVSALSLGTMSWARETDEQDASELLRDVRRCRRHADRHGRVLRRRPGRGDAGQHAGRRRLARSEVVISTKAGIVDVGRPAQRRHLPERHAVRPGREPGQARHRLRGHLVRAGLGRATFRWRRRCPPWTSPSAPAGPATPAISNFTGWQTAKAAAVAGFPLVANQSEYSLLHRRPETELIPAVEDAGLGLMAWAPLGRGVLTGKYRGPHSGRFPGARNQRLAGYVEPYLEGPASSVVEAVAMAAKGLGRTALDVALSWLLSQHGVATAIVGPRTPGPAQGDPGCARWLRCRRKSRGRWKTCPNRLSVRRSGAWTPDLSHRLTARSPAGFPGPRRRRRPLRRRRPRPRRSPGAG